jgi:hypothetical protein
MDDFIKNIDLNYQNNNYAFYKNRGSIENLLHDKLYYDNHEIKTLSNYMNRLKYFDGKGIGN